MKTYLRTLKGTFTSRAPYQSARHQSNTHAIGFIAKTGVLLSLVLTVVGVIVALVVIPKYADRIVGFLDASYPPELVVTVSDGVLTTNTGELVIVPVPHSIGGDTENEFTNLFVLAPNEQMTPSLSERFDAFAVAARDGIVVATGEREYRTYAYGDENVWFDKNAFVTGARLISGGVKIAAIAAVLPVAFVMVFIGLIGHLLWLFFIALLLWVVSLLRKTPYTYGQWYRMGIYALAPLMCIELIAMPLGITGRLFTLVVVVIICLFASHHKGHSLEEKK